MKGMELSSMQQEFDQDKGALQSAGRSASLGDIFGKNIWKHTLYLIKVTPDLELLINLNFSPEFESKLELS